MPTTESIAASPARPRLAVGASWLSQATKLTRHNLMRVILDNATAACEAGFAGLELPLPHAEHLFNELGNSFWAEAREAMTEAGAPVLSIHGPNLPPLDHPDGVNVDKVVRRFVEYARLTNLLGADALVVHPTADSHPHVCDRIPPLLERDTRVCLAVAEALEGTAQLAVENLPTYGLAYLEKLMTDVQHARVGVCFDTGHWHVRPEGTIEQAVSRFAPRLAHLHLSDNHGLCDEHLPPGDGTFPWSRWFAALPGEWHARAMLVELGVPIAAQSPDAWEQTRAQWAKAHTTATAALQTALAPEAQTH